MSLPRKPGLVVLLGPTAVGKSDVAIEMAERLDAEIVSADSRLIYRLMDIGTAKPDRVMRSRVPHHLVDLVDPDHQYTSKDYERDARAAVAGILARGKTPLVVGGTGLYVRALLEGIFDGPPADPAVRSRLAELAVSRGAGYLWSRLAEVDPEKARTIEPRNVRRVIRALEVYEAAGEPMSRLERARSPLGLPAVKLGLARTRTELGDLIDRRGDRMFEAGFVDEVKHLVRAGYGASPVVRSSLGYREVMRHLEGGMTLAEAAALVKRNTRSFAKRQMTWFRKETGTVWVDLTGVRDPAEAAGRLLKITAK